MLKNKKILYLIPILSITLFSFSYFILSDKDEAIDQTISVALNNIHYSPLEINDKFSEKVYKLYLKRLDYNKKFLIQSDIDELKKYEKSIDDDFKNSQFNFFEKSYELILKRVAEAQEYYKDILSQPFDFTKDETIQLDPEKLNFCKSKEELKEAWRKTLKYQTLAKIYDLTEEQEKAREKSDTVKIKSKEEIETEARKKVLKSNDDWFKRIREFNRNDRISIYFNSITGIYDPHTEYYAPKDKQNFDISMSGQLEGIGAQLQEKDGYIKVSGIVPGSPSWKQGQLKVGDLILKVAQGSNEPVDIVDMRMDDVLPLIRGKKGTEVRLTVKKPDGSIIIVPLVRDVIILEETFAQSVVLKGKKKIGYIKLPSFYADFGGQNGGRSSAKDVKKELQKLKAENVEGIILDLRYNGGGSLADVIEMAGLFIEKGPIVQVKQKSGYPDIKEDRDASVVYDGPLVVMVNSNSASASEIMAAAIQDYKRGIIVGTSPTTFGKGTVQRFFSLDDYLPPSYSHLKPLGDVKITMQKFYRINGGSTQLKGVTPDIALPDPYYLLDRGEKEQDYPLAWDEIAPAKYQYWKTDYGIPKLKAASEERIKNNQGFITLNETAKRLKKQKDDNIVPLNYDKFMAMQKKIKEDNKKWDELDKEFNNFEISALSSDPIIPESDTIKTARIQDWYKNIKKDIYLNETMNIMTDIK